MMRHTTVICLGAGKLTSLTRSIYHICNEISKKYQVLYITKPPEGNEMMWGVRLNLVPSITKINKRLFSLEWPCWVLRLHKIRQIDELMTFLRYRIIIRALRKINAGNIAFLYVTHPEGFQYLKFFPRETKIYHVFDNYSHYVSYNKLLEDYEKTTLKDFDYVLYLSKKLWSERMRFNPRSFVLPQGVNFALFSKASSKDTLVPHEIERISNPVIGLIGAISGKIDVDLLLYLADKKPEWFFLVVGPILLSQKDTGTFNKLRSMKNVLVTGHKPPEVLPGYLKAMHVGIMPYRITGHVPWVNPLKVLEYFSAGKPVVSISLDSLKEYSGLIYFADEPNEWIKQIERALSEHGRSKRIKRTTVASSNTWTHRIDQFYEIIGEND